MAALNQSPKEAAAGPFIRVLAEMFGPSRADSSLVLPLKPLHEMYALPAQRYIEARGGEVRLNALARIRIDDGRIPPMVGMDGRAIDSPRDRSARRAGSAGRRSAGGAATGAVVAVAVGAGSV